MGKTNTGTQGMDARKRRSAKTRANAVTLLSLVFMAFSLPACSKAASTASAPPPNTTQTFALSGINFSPYMSGQQPGDGPVSEAQIRDRLKIIAPYTDAIRTFGMSNGLEKTGAIAHALGLKTCLGAWISADNSANEVELSQLISAANAGDADMVVVGGEVMLRGDLSEDELIVLINRVRNNIPPRIPIAYADVYSEFLKRPKLVQSVDVLLASYYPYWEGIPITEAMTAIAHWHKRLLAVAGDKAVYVGESGWPSGGTVIAGAIPSPDNAATFLHQFVTWARQSGIDYFYFEAFDELWKTQVEGPQGAHWGIWHENGELKNGMATVFDGEPATNTWTANAIPGGDGEIALQMLQIPALGSFDNLLGRVLHVDPAYYQVLVYIHVGGGWWNKPTFETPGTPLAYDGSFEVDITTGGVDESADRIRVYVMAWDYVAPLMQGEAQLPAELDTGSLAQSDIPR